MNICKHKHLVKIYTMTCPNCKIERYGHYGDWCNCDKKTPYQLISCELEKIYSKMNFKGIGKLLA